MNDFDDERLRGEFDLHADHGVSVAAAHDAVLARSGRIRRRRAAVAGSGALVVLVVGGLVLLPGGDGDSQAPADSGQPIPSVDDDPVVDDLTGSTTSGPEHSEVDDDPVSTVSTVSTSTTLPAAVATTTNTTAPTATAASTTGTTGTTSEAPATTTAGTSGTSSSSSTTPESSVAPFNRSYVSTGGSIFVDWNGDSFTLLSVAPVPGFEAEIEDQRATRIRVRFRGDDDSRIELRVDNGQLIVDIS